MNKGDFLYLIYFRDCKLAVLDLEENVKSCVFHSVLALTLFFVGRAWVVFEYSYERVTLVFGNFFK